jgi:hypothetical protein
MDKATRELDMRDRLRVEQATWLPLWRDVAAFCQPHKQRIVDNAYAQLVEQVRPRFNPVRQSSTAIDSLNVLSGGLKSWLVPGGDEGLGYMWEPDESRAESSELKDWFAECTQRALPVAERGGFFTASHETFQELGWAGTGGLMMDDGEDSILYCEAMTVVNFLVQRDYEDRVIRVIFTYSLSATIIADKFTAAGDQVPELVRADVASNNGNTKHEVIRSIYKRHGAEVTEDRDHEPAGQPFGSCWIHVNSKTILRERGYQEMPFLAPRWLKWAGTMTSAYGTSPAMQALADCKGLNLLDMIMATRAEIEINPRIKVLPSQSGNIDLSPGGITQMAEKDGVSEWGVAGNYPIGKDQTSIIEARIFRAFFKDLFEAVTPIAQQREINIPVMHAIQNEAASRISPAMGRVKQDYFEPSSHRLFMMCLRGEVFSPPPEEAYYVNAAGRRQLILPKLALANRMSRTLNARKSFAFSQSWSRLQLLLPAKPELADIYDVEAIARDLDRGDGMPVEWHYSETQVKKNRAARAKAAEAQMAQQVMAGAIQKDPVGMAKLAGIGPQIAA